MRQRQATSPDAQIDRQLNPAEHWQDYETSGILPTDLRKMRVLVTGGTGFVGREILWQLAEAGHQIGLLTRIAETDQHRQLAYRFRAELIEGSVTAADQFVDRIRGFEAIIHLVGIISESNNATFQKVHVDGTRAMLQVAQEVGILRFVHMSALGTRENARARYHQTKWEAEKLVRASGLDWTIFRPSVIYGRDDGFVNLLAKICRLSPVIPVFGPGTNKLQPVAVEDVARAFVGALGNSDSIGRTYDLCGREIFTMDQLYDVILRVTKRRRLRVHLPMAIARLQAGFLEWAAGLIGKQSPLTRDQLKMLQEDNVGDANPAKETFGLVQSPFADEIAKYVK